MENNIKQSFSLGEIAELLNIPTSTLRFWEKKGDVYKRQVLVPQDLHTGADVPGLAVSQSAGLHDGLDRIGIRLGQGLHIGEFLIQLFHYHVDPGVCALRCV